MEKVVKTKLEEAISNYCFGQCTKKKKDCSSCELSSVLTLKEIEKEAYANHKKKGFNDEHPAIQAALIHSEVSEFVEAHRRHLGAEAIAGELADIILRTVILAKTLEIDLSKAIIDKMTVNSSRPYKHGGKLY